jgi:hypothetical protein
MTRRKKPFRSRSVDKKWLEWTPIYVPSVSEIEHRKRIAAGGITSNETHSIVHEIGGNS